MTRRLHAEPYAWPASGAFDADTTAVLVIDMQRDFLEEGGYITAQGYDHRPMRKAIEPVKQLLDLALESGMPAYFTRESHRPDLTTLPEREFRRSRNNTTGRGIGDITDRLGRALVRGEPGCALIGELAYYYDEATTTRVNNVIDKPGRSAFAHTELELILRNLGIKNLMICGVTTDVCVHSTMREANDRGFDCVLVADASAAGTETLHHWAVASIVGEGGIFGAVTTVADVRMMLTAQVEVASSEQHASGSGQHQVTMSPQARQAQAIYHDHPQSTPPQYETPKIPSRSPDPAGSTPHEHGAVSCGDSVASPPSEKQPVPRDRRRPTMPDAPPPPIPIATPLPAPSESPPPEPVEELPRPVKAPPRSRTKSNEWRLSFTPLDIDLGFLDES